MLGCRCRWSLDVVVNVGWLINRSLVVRVWQGDAWALVIAGIDEYGGTMLNGREGVSATPWVRAVV